MVCGPTWSLFEKPVFMSRVDADAAQFRAALLSQQAVNLRACGIDLNDTTLDERWELQSFIIKTSLACLASAMLARFSDEFDRGAALKIVKAGYEAMFAEATQCGASIMAAKGKTSADVEAEDRVRDRSA